MALDFAEKYFLIIGVGWPTKQSKLLRNGWILAQCNIATFFWKVETLWRFGGGKRCQLGPVHSGDTKIQELVPETWSGPHLSEI